MKRDKIGIWRGALSLAVVALTLALGSCTKEPILPGGQSDKEYMDFSLELTPPGAYASVLSRAMTDAQQNAINSAEVLIFQNDVLLYHQTGIVDAATKRVVVPLKISQSESDLYDMMVIGNPPSDFDFTPYIAKTKEELRAAFSGSAAGGFSGSEFVMYGEALQTLINPTTNNFKIQMLRSLARVDLGVGVYDEATNSWAGLGDTFSLTEVRVVNSRDKFAVIPSATILSSTGNVKVDVPTVPTDAAAQGTTAETAIKYSDTDITIVDGKGIYTKSTIFIAEAPNTTDRGTLLVGGSYKGGATTYYRIDFCVPKAGASGSYDYLNILRNHLYRINITGVSGAGFTDPQEALVSAPINITTTLTPIEEGGTGGEIIFDGNNYLMSDVSSVQIYGSPDGVKTYPIVTVKAKFVDGVTATVTGPGIGTLNLVNGVSQTISVAIPVGTTTGSYTIKVGRLIKTIPFTVVQPPVDAHFDFLPFQNIAYVSIDNPLPWLTLSHNKIYKPSEQQQTYITGDANGKACFHFDENIATTGAPRMARALIMRKDATSMTGVVFEQRNLSGMVLGYFGGAMGDDGYTQLLAVESVEEYEERTYDDTSIGIPVKGIKWGFFNEITDVTANDLGKAGTFTLAKTKFTENRIVLTETALSIYNNYAARYCYDKNRDANGNGEIDENEVVWYLPAQNQLMGAWVSHSGVEIPFVPPKSLDVYVSTMEVKGGSGDGCRGVNFNDGKTNNSAKLNITRVRCVRDLML